jgi:hypothetical protein
MYSSSPGDLTDRRQFNVQVPHRDPGLRLTLDDSTSNTFLNALLVAHLAP